MEVRQPQIKVGLALGSGAARGLAHLGVLVALQRAKVPIDLIVGTSFGAFVGAIYACNPDAEAVRAKVISFARSRNFRRSKFDFIREAARTEPGLLNTLSSLLKKGIMYSSTLSRNGFISSENMSHNIASCMPGIRVEEAAVPFAAVAADVRTGEEILIRRGAIRTAVHASCAIAGVFRPVFIGDRVLVDGGCVDKVPVIPAYYAGADFVIGVDVCGGFPKDEVSTGADLLLRTSQIEGLRLKDMQLRLADVVIAPAVGNIHWADFRQPEKIAELGQKAVEPIVHEILERIAAAKREAQKLGVSKGRARARHFLEASLIKEFEIPKDEKESPRVLNPEVVTLEHDSSALPEGVF